MAWFKRNAPEKPAEKTTTAETAALLAKTESAVDRLEKTAERLDRLVADLGNYVSTEDPSA